MASLTIDQLKKSLTEQGIALPPHGSKKADYVKLYEQYSTLNENLGDFYSSDDENPPRGSGQSVSSSSSPSKIESIIKEVERLTDDELYTQLKELGASIGPVLKNTRKVYEKKLVKLLGGGGQTNGVDTTGSPKSKSTFRVEEFSDSEIEIPPNKWSYKITSSYQDHVKDHRRSASRDSPKPNVEEPLSEPSVERRFSSHSYNKPEIKSTPPESYSSESKSSKFSFIEKIPKGSTYRYIEPTSEVDYPTNKFRSRFNVHNSDFGQEKYSGTWEPNIKKYLHTQQQANISKRPASSSAVLPPKSSSFKENIIAVVIVVAFISLILYLYFYQWSVADPYKEIEDDAERELENLAAESAA